MNLSVGKPHRLWFCGFNIALIAGVLAVIANQLFDAWYGTWIAIMA